MTSPEALLQLLDIPDTTIAVVGATDDPGKFGHTIYRHLKGKGYRVYPVNPNRASVEGDPAYPRLTDLPHPPTLVNFVTPPKVTLAVLNECLQLGLTQVWLQPGASDAEVLNFLDAHGFVYLDQLCIMPLSRTQA